MKKKSSSAPTPAMGTLLRRLEDQVGDFIEYWGFKKIHGRIWIHLYLSPEPLDAAMLMDRLDVSKGLMSLALRDLLKYEVIKANHVGKHGTVFYIPNVDLNKVIKNVLAHRESKMLAQVETTLKDLKKIHKQSEGRSSAVSPQRLAEVMSLTQSAQSLLKIFLILDVPFEAMSDLTALMDTE